MSHTEQSFFDESSRAVTEPTPGMVGMRKLAEGKMSIRELLLQQDLDIALLQVIL